MNNENNENTMPNQDVTNQIMPKQNLETSATEKTVNNQPIMPAEKADINKNIVTDPVISQNEPPVSPVPPTETVQQTPTIPNVSQSIEMPTLNSNINMQQAQTQISQNINQQQPQVAQSPIINTEAAKVKANELVVKAKAGLENYKEKVKKDKKALIVPIIIIVIILFALANCMQTGGSKSIVKKYANAMVNSNAKKLVKLYHEDYIGYKEEYSDKDFEDILESAFELYEKNDYDILRYKIIDIEKYNKDQVNNYADKLEDKYDIDDKDVKQVYEYSIKYTINNDGDKEFERMEVYAVKIKNKWYIFE